MTRFWKGFWALLIGVPLLAFTVWGLRDNPRLFVVTLLNSLTLASLYFIVASGFTLVFGLMRNVNLAHGSLYLLGGYLGFFTAQFTGSWLLALAAAGVNVNLVFATTFAIGAGLAGFGGVIGAVELSMVPGEDTRLLLASLVVVIGVALWLFLNRTRIGMMIRAGVDDRAMLAAAGVNVNLVFATTFAIGAGLAGFGGVIGAVELSMVPGEDTRLLLVSLVVVIVGGMGSVVGAAVGAAIFGLAETYGLAYAPTYSVVFTFVILVLVLAFRPRGILGRPA